MVESIMVSIFIEINNLFKVVLSSYESILKVSQKCLMRAFFEIWQTA